MPKFPNCSRKNNRPTLTIADLQNNHSGVTGFAFACLVYGDDAVFEFLSLGLFDQTFLSTGWLTPFQDNTKIFLESLLSEVFIAKSDTMSIEKMAILGFFAGWG